MSARLRLVEGPFVSVQDGGRPGRGRYGVGPAGPMDPLTRLLALRLAGVPGAAVAGEPTIEVGPGGARLAAEDGDIDVVVAGRGAHVRLGHDRIPAPAVVRVPAGRELVVAGDARWTSIAVVGRLGVRPVLGSVSRHGRADVGPRWTVGEALAVLPTPERASVRLGTRPARPAAAGPLLLLPGPQSHLFASAERDRLVADPLVVSSRGDRMAHRLDGVRLDTGRGHDVVSDGIVAGAVQVQGDGAPWVLLAEHQPTGGYPKVGVLAAADRCRFVQLPPGSRTRLVWGDVAMARERWDLAAAAVEACVATPPRPTADRLRDARLTGPLHEGAARRDHGAPG